MPENNKNSNTNNEQKNNLSSSFTQYSDALIRNSDALRKNSGSLDSNAGSLDNNTKALLEMAKSFKSTAEGLGKDLNSFADDTKKSFERQSANAETTASGLKGYAETSARQADRTISKQKQVGDALIGSFKVVGQRLITQFSRSMSRVADSYRDNFTDITVKMQWSQSEYSDMFKGMASEFLSQGLGTQFSPTDFATALSETLATGLRGDEAQRQAYQNLITNRLMPAISTNTREYRQMSKFFGTTFTEGITAISKYAESTYGAEGLDENQINNIISATSASMRLQGARSGLSEEEIQNQINELTYGINAMAQAGINPDQFISTLQSTLEGTEINTSFAAAGGGTADALINQLVTDPTGFMERWVNIVAQEGAGQTAQNYVSEALGVNATTGIEALAAVEGGYLNWDQIRQDYSKFDQDAEYDKWMSKLEDGFGKSMDAQADTWEENVTTPLGVMEGEIPRFREIASDVRSILMLLAGSQLFGSGFGSGIGKGLFSKVMSAKGDTKAASELFSEGFKFKDVASVSNKGVAAAGKGAQLGSKALSFVKGIPAPAFALGGGLLLGGIDAIQSGRHAANAGGSAGDILGSSIHGLLTGNTQMTAADENAALEQALSGQGQKFDWGSLIGNTAKYASAGAGAGALIGGVGAVPGAIAGGITGAVENALDQLVTNHKYNELADATNDLTESFTKLQETQQEYETVVSSSASTQQDIDVIRASINGDASVSTEELNESFKALQKAYPEYLGNIKDVSEMDEAYLKIIEKKIEKESDLAKKELAGDIENTSEKMSSKRAKTKDAIGEVKSQASIDTAKDLADLSKGASTKEINAVLKENAEEYGVSVEDLAKELQSGESGEIFNISDSGDIEGFKSGIGDNRKQFYKDYKGSAKSQKKMQSVLAKEVDEIKEIWDSIVAMADSSNIASKAGNYRFDKKDKKVIKGAVNDFNKQVRAHNKTARQYNLGGMEDIIVESEDFDNIGKIYKAAGKGRPSFKIGAYSIPTDMDASLHKGEMVLTSANAEKLRQLDSGGLSGVLNAMQYATELGDRAQRQIAQTSPEDNNMSNVSSVIVSAIESQTEALVVYLSSINTAVMSMVQGTTIKSTKVSEATLTYQGR